MKEEDDDTHVLPSTLRENLHYVLAILFSVTASCLWGVHNITMKYLITRENIRPREYSFCSTFIDGLLGILALSYYGFNKIELFDYDGNLVQMETAQFLADSWIMAIAGFLSGIAILIGLLAVSLGNLGTTQVLLNSYSLFQIMLEIMILGKFPNFY